MKRNGMKPEVGFYYSVVGIDGKFCLDRVCWFDERLSGIRDESFAVNLNCFFTLFGFNFLVVTRVRSLLL